MTDLRDTIVPKSDQLNAEQLLAGPITITVTEVTVSTAAAAAGSKEQPVSIHYQGDNGRPYKPCLTMRKVLILAWGPDGTQWAGKSMELFNDPSVTFGKEAVGGIRISRLSDIPKAIKVSLTATKGRKSLHDIGVLKVAAPRPPLEELTRLLTTTGSVAELSDFWATLTADEKKALAMTKDAHKMTLAAAQPVST